jgi:NADH-quinone oxidoreductase subunit J
MTILPEAAATVIFYLVAAAAIVLALAVVTARRLLRAAIFLMGVLFMSAGLYLLLGAEFLAGIQVLVYVGGIVVLIVFAVMLTHSEALQMDNPPLRRKILGGLAATAFLVMTAGVFSATEFYTLHDGLPPAEGVRAIGKALLDFGPDGYVLPFEVISLLLLAAVIGGIVVARKVPPPRQPFTSGGDMPGEADFRLPNSQRDEAQQAQALADKPTVTPGGEGGR